MEAVRKLLQLFPTQTNHLKTISIMYKFYLVKILYPSVDVNGYRKKVALQYVAKAVSFTDAESTVVKEVSHFAGEDMEIKSITILNIEDIIDGGHYENPEKNKWFKCRAEFTELSDIGKVKKVRHNYLALACSVSEAEQTVIKYLKSYTQDFTTVTVNETKIVDIFINN